MYIYAPLQMENPPKGQHMQTMQMEVLSFSHPHNICLKLALQQVNFEQKHDEHLGQFHTANAGCCDASFGLANVALGNL